MINLNKLFPRLSIRTKLVIAFVLLGVVPVAVVGGYGAAFSFWLLNRTVLDALQEGVSLKAGEVQVSLLDYFHCEGEWGAGPRALLERAHGIETVAHTLRWRQWERYCARQRQRVPMGGWVGRVTYPGDLAPFWP